MLFVSSTNSSSLKMRRGCCGFATISPTGMCQILSFDATGFEDSKRALFAAETGGIGGGTCVAGADAGAGREPPDGMID
jgi:hypothetical protein